MDFAYEQTIENVNDILTALQEIKVHPYKASWWFRGHSKPEYKLAPSVFREFNLMGEWNLYHQFIRKAHSRYSQCPDSKDALGWLTLMQHYGLPTRLLDWSQSVLVAAFFACRSNPQENGILWGMNPSVLIKQQVPTSSEGIFPIHTPLLQENARLALMELGGKVNGTPFSVLPFYPTEIDNRMLLQQSCFTFHTVDAINTSLEIKYSHILAKLTIPYDKKSLILDQLEVLGIEQEQLFPDLHNLAQGIKKSWLRSEKMTRNKEG